MRNIAYRLSLIFIFSIPWEGMIEIPGLGTASKLIGIMTAVWWLATVIISSRLRKPGLFQIVFILFVIWNAVSVLWSNDPNQTLIHTVRWFQLLGLVLILWDLYTNHTAVLAGLQAFILGEYFALGGALYNFFSGKVFYNTYQRFSSSDQSNPDGFGIMMALGIPVVWYLISSKNTLKMNRLFKLLNYAFIPLAFLGISLSGTRTALIASIPGMMYGFSTLIRLKPWVRITIFLFLMSAIIIMLPKIQSLKSFQRFSTTANEITEGDLNNRINNWREGIDSFTEHPFLGVGSNMYRSVFSLGKLAHNSFISVLVELGLIGFLLFGILITYAIIRAWGLNKWDSRFWLTILFVWAICASSLTYEYRKATWLFLSLLTASAALTIHRDEGFTLGLYNDTDNLIIHQTKRGP